MRGTGIRNLIRVLVAAVMCLALFTLAAIPVPDDLPTIALRQPGVYRLEVSLTVFYGGLLLITPAFSGVIQGRLPIEISTRGARFAEGADQTAELEDAAIERLEGTTTALAQAILDTRIQIERLGSGGGSDSSHQAVDSER